MKFILASPVCLFHVLSEPSRLRSACLLTDLPPVSRCQKADSPSLLLVWISCMCLRAVASAAFTSTPSVVPTRFLNSVQCSIISALPVTLSKRAFASSWLAKRPSTGKASMNSLLSVAPFPSSSHSMNSSTTLTARSARASCSSLSRPCSTS